ncbi:MAG: hypothetical protein IJ164_02720 [Duodenibacillus sp.]|nr:hypothetical protein [Duodenibacillus sp.]
MTQLEFIRQGGLLADVDEAIREAVMAVNEKGKAATVSITLTIKPATKNGTNVIITDEVRTKLPKLPSGETILFTSPDGDLAESDPRQGKLEFVARKVEVDKETGEIAPCDSFQKVG